MRYLSLPTDHSNGVLSFSGVGLGNGQLHVSMALSHLVTLVHPRCNLGRLSSLFDRYIFPSSSSKAYIIISHGHSKREEKSSLSSISLFWLIRKVSACNTKSACLESLACLMWRKYAGSCDVEERKFRPHILSSTTWGAHYLQPRNKPLRGFLGSWDVQNTPVPARNERCCTSNVSTNLDGCDMPPDKM